jgi:asparagine synthase (glutamine-hydrolysing)
MCGINGIFAYHPSSGLPNSSELLRTRDHMTNRGPDDAGEWWSEDRRLGLGHRRLSILDLSTRGRQPMESACGRYVVVFNGEIYNYPELRRTLEAEGRTFRSDSDTEVLLHLFALRGEDLVHALRGMFAFAIYDRTADRLVLARDPYGIKPLYYADDGWTCRFASQVKALMAGGKVSADPDPAGVVGFYLWGSVPEPYTLYNEVRAVPAGCTVTIDSIGPHAPRQFCSVSDLFAQGEAMPVAAAEIDQVVQNAALASVEAHLLADVEVGLFLSAGVDSGALLGLMTDAGASKIQAITLSFAEFSGTSEDEAPIAAQIAQHYGAEHVIRLVDETEFRQDLPAILESMDQPSIDGINTWFVAKASSEAGLKVALSGVGGDEVFAGYPSFTDIPRWVRRMRLPSAVPGAGAIGRRLLQAINAGRDNPKLVGLPEYGGSYAGAYLLRRGLFMPWELGELLGDPEFAAEGWRRLNPLRTLRQTAVPPGMKSPTSRIAALESTHYMRNQLLRDSDWAGMAHSLEIRTPLVDIELLRKVAPIAPLLTGRRGKTALAGAPSSPLPTAIADRAKTGFGVPTGGWLTNVAGNQAVAGLSKGTASRDWAEFVISAAHVAMPSRSRAAA